MPTEIYGKLMVHGRDVSGYSKLKIGELPHTAFEGSRGVALEQEVANIMSGGGVIYTKPQIDDMQKLKLDTVLKGANNGLAELDANGKVPSSQLPSFVDDVIEGTLATFPNPGETGKIYVDTNTDKTYRWSGTQYSVISETLSLGYTSTTALRGDYGKTAYDHSRVTTGNPHKVTKGEVGLGNCDNTADKDKWVHHADYAGQVEWQYVVNKPTDFPSTAHNHDDRYYTETEMDAKLGTKFNVSGGTITGDTTIISGGKSTTIQNGVVTSEKFVGAVQGNASSATNADTVDGEHASAFLHLTGGTMTGSLIGQANQSISGFGKVYNAIWNDFAEWYEKEDINEVFEPGDIVSWNETGVIKSNTMCDPMVVGVVSNTYGHIVGGEDLENPEDNHKKFVPIGLCGRVSVKVSGPVSKGDLITTSFTPGVGIPAIKGSAVNGTVIGKALEDKTTLEEGFVKINIMLA